MVVAEDKFKFRGGGVLFIHSNSLVHDLVKKNNDGTHSLTLTTSDAGIHCPVYGCSKAGSAGTIEAHLRLTHINTLKKRFKPDDEYYQPKWLKGSKTYLHRPSGRALCFCTLVVMRRSEIAPHIQSCNGCHKRWRVPCYIPRDESILNTPINPEVEANLPGGFHIWYQGRPWVKYRAHEPFTLFFVIGSHTELGKVRHWENRRQGNMNVEARIILKPGPAPPIHEPRPNGVQELHSMVEHCWRYMNLSSFGLHKAIAERIGTRRWYDDIGNREDGFWFAKDSRNKLDQVLPYPLQDALEMESALVGIEPEAIKSLNTPEAKACRQIASDILHRLLKIVTPVPNFLKPFDTEYVNMSGVKRGLWFNQGKLYIRMFDKTELIPWCVAELLVRHLLIFRPIQEKYDDPKCADSMMLITPYVNRARWRIRTRPQAICDVMNVDYPCTLQQLRDMLSEEKPSISDMNKCMRGKGVCLVKYYE